MNGVKEACCSRCAHLEVCAYKEQLLKAQEAVDKAAIYTQKEDGAVKELRLSNISWIKPVELSCTHFLDRKPQITNRFDTTPIPCDVNSITGGTNFL